MAEKSEFGYVVIFDTADGTNAWGWYQTYEEADEAAEECRETMEIEENSEDWVTVCPCWAFRNTKGDC